MDRDVALGAVFILRGTVEARRPEPMNRPCRGDRVEAGPLFCNWRWICCSYPGQVHRAGSVAGMAGHVPGRSAAAEVDAGLGVGHRTEAAEAVRCFDGGPRPPFGCAPRGRRDPLIGQQRREVRARRRSPSRVVFASSPNRSRIPRGRGVVVDKARYVCTRCAMWMSLARDLRGCRAQPAPFGVARGHQAVVVKISKLGRLDGQLVEPKLQLVGERTLCRASRAWRADSRAGAAQPGSGSPGGSIIRSRPPASWYATGNRSVDRDCPFAPGGRTTSRPPGRNTRTRASRRRPERGGFCHLGQDAVDRQRAGDRFGESRHHLVRMAPAVDEAVRQVFDAHAHGLKTDRDDHGRRDEDATLCSLPSARPRSTTMAT